MKRIIEGIDIHIVVMGLLVTLLFVSLVSVITFVPGLPHLALSLTYGIIPLLVVLEPPILTHVYDHQKCGHEVLNYFIVNSLLATIFGLICGFWLYAILPREILDQVAATIPPLAFLPS